MSTSTTGTPAPGSTSTTTPAPTQQQTNEISLMAAMIFPYVQNRSTDQNDVARAVQLALMIPDEAAKQEKQKQKDDQAKAQAQTQAQADAAGGITALAKDPVVEAGFAPGASSQDMRAALDRIKAAAQAAEQSSQSQSSTATSTAPASGSKQGSGSHH